MRRALAGVLASLTLLTLTAPAAVATSATGPALNPNSPAASDSVPDAWTMFVEQFARDRGLSWERAQDQIGAWLRCIGVRGCRPRLEQWRRIAADAGWPESDWGTVSCLIWVESRADEKVVYRGTRRRPEHSVGLLQLNTRGRLLDRFGGLDRDQLLDPFINLSEGRKIFEAEGLRPWGGRCRR